MNGKKMNGKKMDGKKMDGKKMDGKKMDGKKYGSRQATTFSSLPASLIQWRFPLRPSNLVR
ncbi:MAG: hypothetical protein ABL974_15640 [Prosthecobacter sp.]